MRRWCVATMLAGSLASSGTAAAQSPPDGCAGPGACQDWGLAGLAVGAAIAALVALLAFLLWWLHRAETATR